MKTQIKITAVLKMLVECFSSCALCVCILFFMATGCGTFDDNTTTPTDDENDLPKIEVETFENILKYEKTELGGCNLKSSSFLKSDHSDDDPERGNIINISVKTDTVQIFIGLNYVCRGFLFETKYEPFETKIEMIDHVLYMYLIAKGSGSRCMCYYTFDFIFKRESDAKLNQKYKILLIDEQFEKDVIISEGVILDNE